ncbi:MAG: hypothetical protein H6867_07060 [Rhodospirillales bacterium]|nr:hypothetical protein [Rhodospirillales bacterium]MCB9995309.1 hypothetical protein [Rhodospirillales bacterium]
MTIPPILANNPLLKLFRNDQQGTKAAVPAVSPQTHEDIVEISEAAQQHLNGVRDIAGDGEARETAKETADILQDSEYTLGLDPGFPS